MKLSCKSKIFALACAAMAAGLPGHSTAQDIVENQGLSFGTIAVVSTGAVGRVTLSPSGTYSYNSNVYLLTPPELGEYTITGGPPNTAFTVSVPVSVSITGPGGPFTLDTLEVRPLSLVTDASGERNFTISGRLQTLGGGTPYNDGTYSTNFPITVNF